jgi:hypothetical protein
MIATSHDATPVVPVAVSVQLPELLNSSEGGQLKLTVPDGVVAPLDAVSVTVALHTVALSTVTELGEQPTLVDVGSTAGGGDVAVTEPDRPLLVLWVLSPW